MEPMKKTISGVLVTLIGLLALPGHAGSSEDEVAAVIRGLQTDWNGGDMTAYLQAYVQSDELRLLSSAGIYKGWDAVNTTFREQFPDEPRMGDFTVDGLEVRLLTDDIAFASGSFEHVFTELTVRGSFSHVLKRQEDGRWLIELEHVSRTEVIQAAD